MNDIAERSFSERYPLIGHRDTGLSAVQYEVWDATGRLQLDPTTALKAGMSESLRLGQPALPSILSGELGYLFRTNEVEIPLTAAELYRLFRFNLRPEEFRKLAETVGVFYEINSKFYDEDSGLAIDPKFNAAEERALAAEAHLPHLFVIQDSAGMLNAHTIVDQSTADRLRHDFLIDGVPTRALPLQPLADVPAAELGLFGNVVGIVEREDEVRAYGPFEFENDWHSWRLRQFAHSVPPARYSWATVNSLFTRS